MSWNIFKRVAELEQQVKDLTDFSGDKARWLGRLEENITHIENKLFIQAVERNAFNAAPIRSEGKAVFTKTELDGERLRRSQYQREWYAKNKDVIIERRNAAKKLKNAQRQGDSKKTYYWKNREKMREYARQYYHKKKAKTLQTI